MSSEVDNVAFAIPSNLCVSLANSIKHYGKLAKPSYAVLGMLLEVNTENVSISNETGAVVNQIVVKDSYGAAELAGI